MRKARPGALRSEHGRYIYAYCHIRTKQVVYSLSQTLNSNAALKQLPDTGANNTPTHIRKDLWKPLYTLSLPTSHPHTVAQGIHAFKKLREYRKLHELCWTPSPLLSKPYTDAQIEAEREKLTERGGSKKESVYDVIKRRKRHMRVKGVMNQKANSVADLAAVLLEQEEMGVKAAEEKEKEGRQEREKEVKEMLALAEAAGRGELETLEQQVESMKQRLESKDDDPEGLSKTKLKREWYRLKARRLRMQFAANAVADAKNPERRQELQAERQQEQSKGSQQEQEHLKEQDSLNRSKARVAREMRELARQAEAGGLARLDGKLADRQARLTALLRSDPEAADIMRASIHGLRLKRKQMQLAHDAAVAPTYSGDMTVEADELRVRTHQYKVDLAGDEIKEAEQQGASIETLEALRSAREFANVQLQSLQAAGVVGEQPTAANADRVSEPEQGASEKPMLTLDGKPISGRAVAPSTSGAAAQTTSVSAQAGGETQDVDWASALPSFPPREDSKMPKRGPLRQKLRRANNPVFSTEGVTIKWHDLLDAEYAEFWPESVRHERMGWSKYVAPHASAEAIDDVSEWKAQQWGKRSANWLPALEGNDETALEEGRVSFEVQRRRDLLDGVKSDILKRIRENEAIRGRQRQARMGFLPEPSGEDEQLNA